MRSRFRGKATFEDLAGSSTHSYQPKSNPTSEGRELSKGEGVPAEAPKQCLALTAQDDLMPANTSAQGQPAARTVPGPTPHPTPAPAWTASSQRTTSLLRCRCPRGPMAEVPTHTHTSYPPAPPPLPCRSSGPGGANSVAKDSTRAKLQLGQGSGFAPKLNPK